jgi:hypothetical protein
VVSVAGPNGDPTHPTAIAHPPPACRTLERANPPRPTAYDLRSEVRFTLMMRFTSMMRFKSMMRIE